MLLTAPYTTWHVSQAILTRHLAKLPAEEIRDQLGERLTDVTLELYNFIIDKLPPTPSRFHYIFNLRDLSRIYEGLLLSVGAWGTPSPAHSALPVPAHRVGLPA